MTEQQRYDVIHRYPEFELRRYPAHLVAEVEVESSFADAGNRAFRMLAAYISGRNNHRDKVAMTAPVVQESASSRIAMTAPVLQEGGQEQNRHVVAFVMPAEYTADTLPAPTDSRITIREVPTQTAATKRFSGFWSEKIYQDQLSTLRTAVEQAGFQVTGPPRFARFNPPWTPWFLRRNEVVLPVEESDHDPDHPE